MPEPDRKLQSPIRRTIYWCIVLAILVLFTFPHATFVSNTISRFVDELRRGNSLQNAVRRLTYFEVPGFACISLTGDPASQRPFWRDGFVHRNSNYWNGRASDQYKLIDAETGKTSPIPGIGNVIVASYPDVLTVGSRLWIWTSLGVSEYIDGRLEVANVELYSNGPTFQNCLFLNDELVYFGIQQNQPTIVVYRSIRQTLVPAYCVTLPDFSRPRSIDGHSEMWNAFGLVQCMYDGKYNHLFVTTDHGLLHKQDFEVEPFPTTPTGGATPCSALVPANTDDDLSGWSLVRPKYDREQGPSVSIQLNYLDFPILVGQQPAIISVPTEDAKREPLARIYRKLGSHWTETGTLSLPFGSIGMRAGIGSSGERSYFVSTTFCGIAHIYAIEPEGIRKIRSTPMESRLLIPPIIRDNWDNYGLQFCIYNVILLLTVTAAMRFGTDAKYEFGIQNVRLASLTARGFAKFIDLSLIIGTTVLLETLMSRGFDWLTYYEALNARIYDPSFDHPLINQGRWIFGAMFVWIVLLLMTFIKTQGTWGITPGKWLLRLRTVRTSLRPCGFARSLAREIVAMLDFVGGFCLTPGILCIALTTTRQRLGDLVADTIVVRASSLCDLTAPVVKKQRN